MPYTQVIAAFISPTRELAKMARRELEKMGLSSRFDIYEEISEDLLPDILNGDKNYQLILATGAAAMYYRQDGRVTVLELLPDLTSFLDDIKDLTSRGIKSIAILGTTNYISSVIDFAIDGAKLRFYPVEFVHNLPNAIEAALLPGVDGVLGGSFTCKYMQEHHPDIAYRRFSYSLRALTNILNATQRIIHLEKVKRLQLTRLELIISNIQQGIVIFNKKKETVFHNAQADQILKNHELEAWYDFMEPFFESTYNVQSVVNIDDKQVLMHTMRFVFPDTDIDNYVVIMQEGSSIERNEHTLRRHKIAKGLIARSTFSSILYHDPLMHDVINKAKLFASTDSTVMIYGETGVGKEVMAQSIHNHSARKSEPFVSLNCASLPPSLIESELFGYAEGAFTGARKQGKKGLFELANGGTIFLDEIGELPLEVQTRLLRVIQEREVRRVGDDKIIPLDVRIVCATNRDLLQMCHQGNFRLDLYYRVNVLKLVIPPLKARPLDILVLFNKFVTDLFGKSKAKKLNIDEDAKSFLMSYSWPGNIRELRNVAEAVVLYGPHITLKTLCDVINPYHDSTYQQYAAMLGKNNAMSGAALSGYNKAAAMGNPMGSGMGGMGGAQGAGDALGSMSSQGGANGALTGANSVNGFNSAMGAGAMGSADPIFGAGGEGGSAGSTGSVGAPADGADSAGAGSAHGGAMGSPFTVFNPQGDNSANGRNTAFAAGQGSSTPTFNGMTGFNEEYLKSFGAGNFGSAYADSEVKDNGMSFVHGVNSFPAGDFAAHTPESVNSSDVNSLPKILPNGDGVNSVSNAAGSASIIKSESSANASASASYNVNSNGTHGRSSAYGSNGSEVRSSAIGGGNRLSKPDNGNGGSEVFLDVPPSSFPATFSLVTSDKIIRNMDNSKLYNSQNESAPKDQEPRSLREDNNYKAINIVTGDSTKNTPNGVTAGKKSAGTVDTAQVEEATGTNIDASIAGAELSSAGAALGGAGADKANAFTMAPNGHTPIDSSCFNGVPQQPKPNIMDAAINSGIYQPWTTPYADANAIASSHVPELEQKAHNFMPISANGIVEGNGVVSASMQGNIVGNAMQGGDGRGINQFGNMNSTNNLPHGAHNQNFGDREAKVTPSILNDSDSVLRLNIRLGESLSLKDIERLTIQALLESHSQNEVCDLLGISRVTLWRKLKNE